MNVMRLRWIAMAFAIVVVIVFALPAIAWAMIPKPDPATDAKVIVTFKAYRASAADYSRAGFSIEWAVEGESPEKVDYISYIGEWWGNIISPGEAVAPTSYPYVAMSVVWVTMAKLTGDSGYTAMPCDYEPYTWGQRFEKSFTLTIPRGHELMGQVQIYHAQSAAIHISEYWTVP